jgi:hypothetical protein
VQTFRKIITEMLFRPSSLGLTTCPVVRITLRCYSVLWFRIRPFWDLIVIWFRFRSTLNLIPKVYNLCKVSYHKFDDLRPAVPWIRKDPKYLTDLRSFYG